MCGRYYVEEDMAEELQMLVNQIEPKIQMKRTGDILPSQSAMILRGTGVGLKAEEMKWGFLSPKNKGLLINARAETVMERKMFRDSVLHRRCVIPAKQFYEWDSGKNKAIFLREDGAVLYMAGFYNRFQKEERFIILTTQANESVRKVHERMPLILEKNELENWVYEDGFLEFALHKIPVQLKKIQEYEQQTLF